MSTSPSKKPSPAVYRRRRLVALLLLVLVVTLIWWLFSAVFGGGGDADSTTEPTSTAAETGAEAPVESPVPSPEPEETPTPTPTVEAEPTPTVCTEDDVAVEAVVDSESYGEGEFPRFSVHLENTTDTSCIIDIGTASQVYTVMSGSDTIWVSTHCQSDANSQVVELVAGKEVDAPAIEWARERSSEGTCDDEQRPDAVGGGAYYFLTVKVGGITSEPVYFELY